MQDAIAANQFYKKMLTFTDGDVETVLSSAEHILEGENHIGGQDHFYLETIGCLVVPKGEDGEIEIVSSTQRASHVQTQAARVMGIPANKVVSRVKRIGGGFGGKATQPSYLSSAVAVAANKVKRPVRIMLDRNEDMFITGGRHPYLSRYCVGFTSEGRITALDMQLFGNGGSSQDLSIAVLDHVMAHCDNAYKIPNFRVFGRVCRTNLPSCTGTRGFGGPQGLIITEQWMQRVAEYLQLPPEKVRELNFHHDGDTTPYGQVQPSCHISRCWRTLMEESKYQEWRVRVDEYNKCNSWKKRGLAIIPVMFPVGFGMNRLQQAGALLHVYTDGSILLTHGGMEMGQGLHTKMVQVCACCLGIPVDKVHISETSTASVPNASPTAGSSSTDLYDMAVKNCCEQIMERLKPFHEADPKAGWEEWVEGAFTQGVGLFTMEQHGGPGTYKIPSCSDIPVELNVTLLDKVPNPQAIFSKAVGEPPLLLAASVFVAIRDAVTASRAERGITAPF